jgi:hypothetical protein
MAIDQTAPTATEEKSENRALARRLNVTARGLFFIWLGVAVLAQLGWGWTLLGIGVIVLGEQAARWRLDLKLSTAWTIGGAIFLVGGLWQLIHIQFPLAPLLLILLGATIIWNGFFSKTEK